MLCSLKNKQLCSFLFYKYGDAVTSFQNDNYIPNTFGGHYNGFIQIKYNIKQFLKCWQLTNSLTVFLLLCPSYPLKVCFKSKHEYKFHHRSKESKGNFLNLPSTAFSVSTPF